jgi:transposase
MFSLPFQLPGFAVTQVVDSETIVVVYATAQQATASCPRCHHPSQSVHSYYSRSPQDLPISGKTVRVVLRVRRFRCQNPACQQRTFAERHPEVVLPHAQRTKRLTTSIRHFGGEVSSEPAARLLSRLGILVSSATLLRLVKRTPEEPLSVPEALGVDDFAFRRGHSYGTLLVEYDNASGILCSESSEERLLETFGSPLFTTVALRSLKQEEWEERWKTYDQDSQDQREPRCSLPSGIC